MQKIVLASGNAGKLRELGRALQPLDWEVVPQSAFDVPDAVEDGLSFVENALIKARHASRLSGLPALADDSGLAVDALGGAPGIRSARFAGEGASDADNNRKLLELMAEVPDDARGAEFICVLVLVRHAEDPVPLIAEGRWRGSILRAPRGSNGFGYDPLFWVPERGCASAELSPEEKGRLSHRGRAVAELVRRLSR